MVWYSGMLQLRMEARWRVARADEIPFPYISGAHKWGILCAHDRISLS